MRGLPHPTPTWLQRLDGQSRVTIRRTLLILVLILVWSAFLRAELPDRGVVSIIRLAGAATALAALVLREPIGGPTLNRWDEAIAFIGLASLLRLLG